MAATSVGADIMKPIAAPILGGMITSTVHVLIVTPVIFYLMKLRLLRRGHARGVEHGEIRVTLGRRGSPTAHRHRPFAAPIARPVKFGSFSSARS